MSAFEQLQRHFVAGRPEQWELEDRVERALVAKTRGQLDGLTSDGEGGPARQPTRRLRPGVVGAVGVVALGGFAAANVPSASVQEQTCVATGVAAPDDVDCPFPTRQQDQLMHDAQVVVATSQGKVGEHDLDDSVRRARSAASDAALLALEADQAATCDLRSSSRVLKASGGDRERHHVPAAERSRGRLNHPGDDRYPWAAT